MPLLKPEHITGDLRLWLRADSLEGTSKSNISVWPDESGNGYHATQSTADDQPAILNDHQNGLPALVFDGSSDFMTLDGTDTAGDNSPLDAGSSSILCATVCSPDAASGSTETIWSMNEDSSDAAMWWRWNKKFNFFYHQGTTALQSTVYDAGDTVVAVASLNDSDVLSWRLDGVQKDSRTGETGGTDAGPFYLAAENGGSPFFNGKLYEIIIFHSDLSDYVDEIEGYLHHKWGLQSSLPSSHTYVDTPPVAGYTVIGTTLASSDLSETLEGDMDAPLNMRDRYHG
ncbi:MAG: hypothetical protein Tp1125DCM238401_29 [Prokaryotic dsDNA virus sp.]|nr:MAG: hypothetical protein Tp1125DCM238401_29 [Prokaryotic dsDNA virus sp.]|tara:strand:- start:2116 stop:2973 length:858 start_codon:yes stop_codon:yes gene_type:complete